MCVYACDDASVFSSISGCVLRPHFFVYIHTYVCMSLPISLLHQIVLILFLLCL